LRRERARYDERVSRESAEREAADAKAAAAEVTHEVQPGDTLSGIAEQFGVNYMEIARANGIENPDLIHPGRVFTIPK
jgi:nucleoid-associated protein YgaU